MNIMATSAVILFDFDGVIIDSEQTSFEAWKTVFRDQGISLTLQDWLQFVGVATGRSPVDFLEELSGTPQPQAQKKKDIIHAELTRFLPCRPGVFGSIQRLAARGIEIHIVSNARQAYIQSHLERLNLSACVSGVISGGESIPATSKCALYTRAYNTLGLQQRSTLVVEDSEHGVRSALACRLRVLGFPNEITVHQEIAALCPIVPYP